MIAVYCFGHTLEYGLGAEDGRVGGEERIRILWRGEAGTEDSEESYVLHIAAAR